MTPSTPLETPPRKPARIGDDPVQFLLCMAHLKKLNREQRELLDDLWATYCQITGQFKSGSK